MRVLPTDIEGRFFSFTWRWSRIGDGTQAIWHGEAEGWSARVEPMSGMSSQSPFVLCSVRITTPTGAGCTYVSNTLLPALERGSLCFEIKDLPK